MVVDMVLSLRELRDEAIHRAAALRSQWHVRSWPGARGVEQEGRAEAPGCRLSAVVKLMAHSREPTAL